MTTSSTTRARSVRTICLTTGTFTKSALRRRHGRTPSPSSWLTIDRSLELLIEEGLGVRETKALTIDRHFFAPNKRAGGT